jgi:hypothetical protein
MEENIHLIKFFWGNGKLAWSGKKSTLKKGLIGLELYGSEKGVIFLRKYTIFI